MSKYIPIIILILLPSSFVFAKGDYSALWQVANNHFEEKNYDSAEYYYKQIAKEEPRNAEIFYNLGNTYYRMNDVGNAVLNYEKTLHLQPSHTQAADNLYLTQNRIENRIQQMPEIFFVKWWKSITSPRLSNTYAALGLILFLLILGYYILFRLGKIKVVLPAQATIATLFVCIILLTLGMVSGSKMKNSGMAVIMQDDTPMMAEPKYGKSLSLIPEGTTIEICDEKADWREITLPDGRTGWVQQAAIAKI